MRSSLLVSCYVVSWLVVSGWAGTPTMGSTWTGPQRHGLSSVASQDSVRDNFATTVTALTSLSRTSSQTDATVSSTVNAGAAAPTPCVLKEFRTGLVKQACALGGQQRASDVMKIFMKEKKVKSCMQCHSKLAPKYELKPSGVAQFFKVGGK